MNTKRGSKTKDSIHSDSAK